MYVALCFSKHRINRSTKEDTKLSDDVLYEPTTFHELSSHKHFVDAGWLVTNRGTVCDYLIYPLSVRLSVRRPSVTLPCPANSSQVNRARATVPIPNGSTYHVVVHLW